MGHSPWGHTELDTTEAAQHIGTCPRFTEEKTGSWRLTSKARKRNPGLSALRPGEGRLQLEDCLGCVTCPPPATATNILSYLPVAVGSLVNSSPNSDK